MVITRLRLSVLVSILMSCLVILPACTNNSSSPSAPSLTLALHMQKLHMQQVAIGDAIKQHEKDKWLMLVNDLQASVQTISEQYPTHPRLQASFNELRAIYLTPVLEKMKVAAEVKDEVTIGSQYKILINKCISCHIANGIVANVVPVEW